MWTHFRPRLLVRWGLSIFIYSSSSHYSCHPLPPLPSELLVLWCISFPLESGVVGLGGWVGVVHFLLLWESEMQRKETILGLSFCIFHFRMGHDAPEIKLLFQILCAIHLSSAFSEWRSQLGVHPLEPCPSPDSPSRRMGREEARLRNLWSGRAGRKCADL